MGTIASDRVTLLMSFRARLLFLLTSFLLLTTVLVVLLDSWAHKRADAELDKQSQRVKTAFNTSFGDFAQATSLAVQSLRSSEFLYQMVMPEDMPATVKDIIVATDNGEVKDGTLREMIGKRINIPDAPQESGEEQVLVPVEGEVELEGTLVRTYNIPVMTMKGLHWIVVVMQQEAIINEIDTAQALLTHQNRMLSNYRLGATAGLLSLALAIAVVIGWRFTQPIQLLADAAQRVASGDLDFRVDIERRDEVGQLAATFNNMIDGLKSKLELEKRLNQSERAAAIGRLTQAVAHEIRNPLNVISLSVDHLGKKFTHGDRTNPDQITRLITSVKDEITRIGRMASDLMNYGRPAPLSLERIDMRELLRETITLVSAQADEQDVEIDVEDDGAPVNVMGDGERLKSCLSNIAINALQAMPEGGRLTARVHKSDGVVEVSVADTGVGISPESINKIFEPYFSTKKTGFGLGLAVTKKIIEEHHGSIEVRSEINHGTSFTLKLPAS